MIVINETSVKDCSGILDERQRNQDTAKSLTPIYRSSAEERYIGGTPKKLRDNRLLDEFNFTGVPLKNFFRQK